MKQGYSFCFNHQIQNKDKLKRIWKMYCIYLYTSFHLPFFLIVVIFPIHQFLYVEIFLFSFFRLRLLGTNLSFPVHDNVLISLSFPSPFFLDIKFWIDSSVLAALEVHHATSLWPLWFMMRNLLSFELFFHCR